MIQLNSMHYSQNYSQDHFQNNPVTLEIYDTLLHHMTTLLE